MGYRVIRTAAELEAYESVSDKINNDGIEHDTDYVIGFMFPPNVKNEIWWAFGNRVTMSEAFKDCVGILEGLNAGVLNIGTAHIYERDGANWKLIGVIERV